MCGIVGYIGERPVLPLLINGLKRLEYRGYDSAGIAVIDDGKLWIRKNGITKPDRSPEGRSGYPPLRPLVHNPLAESPGPHRSLAAPGLDPLAVD